MPEATPPDHAPSGRGQHPKQHPSGRGATRRERVLSAVVGALLLGGGVTAVFVTDNELGSLGLIVLGAALLVLGVFGLVPAKVGYGDWSVELGRELQRTFETIARTENPVVREAMVDSASASLAAEGLVPVDDAVRHMLGRFDRYTGTTNASALAHEFRRRGWTPTVPGAATYVLWRLAGPRGSASLYQNSGLLLVKQADLQHLFPNAPAGANGQRRIDYGVDLAPAIDALDRVQAHVGAVP